MVATVYREVREGFTNKVTFEQNLERTKSCLGWSKD